VLLCACDVTLVHPYMSRGIRSEAENIMTVLKTRMDNLKYRRDWTAMEQQFTNTGLIEPYLYSFHVDYQQLFAHLDSSSLFAALFSLKQGLVLCSVCIPWSGAIVRVRFCVCDSAYAILRMRFSVCDCA